MFTNLQKLQAIKYAAQAQKAWSLSGTYSGQGQSDPVMDTTPTRKMERPQGLEPFGGANQDLNKGLVEEGAMSKGLWSGHPYVVAGTGRGGIRAQGYHRGSIQ